MPSGKSTRLIQVERDLLDENNRLARANRAFFQQNGLLALNLVSSPGAGKTTLLVRSLELLRGRVPLAVIEGDQETDNDAARVRSTGVPAIQVNTGKGCHLDAPMVAAAFSRLHLPAHGPGQRHQHEAPAHGHGHEHGHGRAQSLLFIENVGNLVCPAMWDLGEAAKIAILSVTEGEDKPLKYPDLFAAAKLMVLNKTDLLPYLDFDVPACIAHARRVNPGIEVLLVSAKTGAGLDAWVEWLLHPEAA